MFSRFSELGFAKKFFIGCVFVGLFTEFSNQFSDSSRQSELQTVQQKCIKEAEELKENAQPHEVWKKVPPVCEAEDINKLEQKTSTQKAILEMNDEKKSGKSFPSFIWFIVIGFIPTLIKLIRRQMGKIDKNG